MYVPTPPNVIDAAAAALAALEPTWDDWDTPTGNEDWPPAWPSRHLVANEVIAGLRQAGILTDEALTRAATATTVAVRADPSARRFVLLDTRNGTVVADGVRFPDGHCATRWRGKAVQTCAWDSIGCVDRAYGHDGRVVVLWEGNP